MSEARDPMIKLFGKAIEQPDSGGNSGEDCLNRDPCCSSDSMLEDCNFNTITDNQDSPMSLCEDHPAEEEEFGHFISAEASKDFDTTASASSPRQEKALKKPEKIFPCPRCNSMDTKFCYFNNYNVNQPRHFCKNCQRYWTAGGTMRNVPVGAGRRKNKNSICQFRHVAIPEAPQTARVELPNEIHHPPMNPNCEIISSTASPLCESMASVLNIAAKTIRSCPRNGFCGEFTILVPHGSKEDAISQSSTAATTSKESGQSSLPELMLNCHPFPPQVPYFVGSTWPYPLISTPPPYWGCALPGIWNVPVSIRTTDQPMHTLPSSSPNSPTLGKHSRDDSRNLKKEERALKETDSNKSVWAPKTLRIDDPGEASKSSIWTKLIVKKDKPDTVIVGGGLFKAFQSQSKSDERIGALDQTSAVVLQANPAALSRSMRFHESQ